MILALCAFGQQSRRPSPTPQEVSNPEQQKSATAQPPAASDQRGTDQSPLVVKTLPPIKTQEEADREKEERSNKSSHDWWLIFFSGVLAGVGVLQLIVFGYQANQLRKTVEAYEGQSIAMERHIGEATRSANAMEHIATVIESGNAAIMRAYISVVIGGAVFQDRQEGVRFEGKPNLVNTGSTPAKNLKIRIAAEIVPFADAETFAYPLPQEVGQAPSVAAPHQSYILGAIVPDLVPDVDVADIKLGRDRKGALTVWGVVTYDDIFGENHTTKFGQLLFWYPNQTVYGYYIAGQNDMN